MIFEFIFLRRQVRPRHHPVQPRTPGGCFLAPPHNHPGWLRGGDPDVILLFLRYEFPFFYDMNGEINSAPAPQLECARFLTELDLNNESHRERDENPSLEAKLHEQRKNEKKEEAKKFSSNSVIRTLISRPVMSALSQLCRFGRRCCDQE